MQPGGNNSTHVLTYTTPSAEVSISRRVSNPDAVYHAPKSKELAFKIAMFCAVFKVTNEALCHSSCINATAPSVG